MKNKFSKIFSSAPSLFLLSFLLAASFWFWITAEQSPIETIVISNVPVTLSLPSDFSDSGLKIYGNSEYTVDVTVTGKRYAIQSLTPADFNATAILNKAGSAGTKSLPVKIEPKDSKLTNYEITSLSKNTVNIFVDTPETREFDVKVVTNASAAEISNNIKLGEPLPSSPVIKVTGPSTELDRILHIVANVTLQGKITETKEYIPEITFKELDSEQGIKYSEFESLENFNVTIPIYVQKELPLKVIVKDIPENKDATVSLAKESAVFWVPADKASKISEAVIKTINFSELTRTNYQFALTFDECEYSQVIPVNSVWCSIKIVDVSKNT